MPSDDHSKLAELERRIQEQEREIQQLKTSQAVDQERWQAMKARLETFVTKAQFEPVKAIVFGAAGSILLTVLGGILVLVVRK